MTVAEQEIWELRVYPMVPASFYATSTAPGSQRFHEAFATDRPQVAVSGVPQVLFPPWRLVIEGITTTTVLPDPGVIPITPSDLSTAADTAAAAFYKAVTPDFQGTSTLVTFDKGDPSGPRRYRYTARIDLARQVWRWEGRPVDPFPFEAARDPLTRNSSHGGRCREHLSLSHGVGRGGVRRSERHGLARNLGGHALLPIPR